MDSNTKAVFVSAVKGICKIFYTMGHVWIGWKIQSNEKWFPLTVKYQPLKCKIVYTSLLPSNQLHPFSAYLNRERERESLNLRFEPCHHRPLDRTLVILILSSPEACRCLTDLVISISSPMTYLVVHNPLMTDLSLSFLQFSITLSSSLSQFDQIF